MIYVALFAAFSAGFSCLSFIGAMSNNDHKGAALTGVCAFLSAAVALGWAVILS